MKRQLIVSFLKEKLKNSSKFAALFLTTIQCHRYWLVVASSFSKATEHMRLTRFDMYPDNKFIVSPSFFLCNDKFNIVSPSFFLCLSTASHEKSHGISKSDIVALAIAYSLIMICCGVGCWYKFRHRRHANDEIRMPMPEVSTYEAPPSYGNGTVRSLQAPALLNAGVGRSDEPPDYYSIERGRLESDPHPHEPPPTYESIVPDTWHRLLLEAEEETAL